VIPKNKLMKVALITTDGIGSSIHGINCKYFIENNSYDSVKVFYPSDENKAQAIRYLHPEVMIIPEEYQYNHNFIKDASYIERFKMKYGNYDKYYYYSPDLLFNHKYAFDYKRYNVSPETIKQHKGLTKLFKPEKCIYVGLTTSTPGYTYNYIKELLINLSERLPDREIFFPAIKKWAGVDLDYSYLTGLPENVTIANNPNIVDSIKKLCKSEYGIYTCNGPSHIAYSLGQPRIVIDPQYFKLPWLARFKETGEHCIPFDTPPAEVGKIVELNIREPISLLFDRKFLFNIVDADDLKNKILYKTI
jgi:hypothetical protein